MFAPKKILVPTDFSEQSDMAFKKAIDIAYQYQSTIYLLHVMKATFYNWAFLCGSGCGLTELLQTEEDGYRRYAKKMLTAQMESSPLAKKIEIVPIIKIGSPWSVVLREQEERGIDLMVIGSKKQGGLMRRFTGPMAYPVVGDATPPSLVVHC